MGIWRRDIRNQVSIEVKDLTKLLNSLEKRNIIKKVGTSGKARYMLSGLQPDRSITGGAFYEGDRFDKELVEVFIFYFTSLQIHNLLPELLIIILL